MNERIIHYSLIGSIACAILFVLLTGAIDPTVDTSAVRFKAAAVIGLIVGGITFWALANVAKHKED